DAYLRDLFEENEEASDGDEEHGREANEKQLEQLSTATARLKSLHRRIQEFEEKLKQRHPPTLKANLEKSQVRLKERVKRELRRLGLSRHLQEAVIAEL